MTDALCNLHGGGSGKRCLKLDMVKDLGAFLRSIVGTRHGKDRAEKYYVFNIFQRASCLQVRARLVLQALVRVLIGVRSRCCGGCWQCLLRAVVRASSKCCGGCWRCPFGDAVRALLKSPTCEVYAGLVYLFFPVFFCFSLFFRRLSLSLDGELMSVRL